MGNRRSQEISAVGRAVRALTLNARMARPTLIPHGHSVKGRYTLSNPLFVVFTDNA